MYMPLKYLTSKFATTQNMNHVARKAFGDSESFINVRALDKPYQGILQGNGSGPIAWTVTSTPEVEVLKDIGCGVSITTAITKQPNKTIGSIFFDDTYLATGELNTSSPCACQVVNNVQMAIEW